MEEAKEIVIRTFGYFDIFVNGEAIPFSCKKAKELLALLVDRRGGFVTTSEAASQLWENMCAGESANQKCRVVFKNLKETLNAYEIGIVLRRVNQESCIRMEYVQCDLYDYLEDEEKYKSLFRGAYMTNYSWAEETLGALMNNRME